MEFFKILSKSGKFFCAKSKNKIICIDTSVKKQNNSIITITLSTNNFNPLSINPTKWSDTIKQFVSCCQQVVECIWTFCGVGA